MTNTSDVPAQTPTTVPSPRLGRVALIAAVVLISTSVLLSVILGLVGAPYVDHSGPAPSFYFYTTDANPVIAGLALAGVAHPLIGTFVGLWIIVQSIVAITANRGRRPAIVALVLAVVAPFVSLTVYLLIMLLPR
jgi:hypothetical protein